MTDKSDSELQNIIQNRDRYEVDACIAAIEELERRQLASPELLQEKDRLKENEIQKQAQETQGKSDKRQGFKETLYLFRISRSYFYTPIIIYLNVLIFILMALMGVDPIEPTVESLISWGGNLRALTLIGEQWRLLTSTFLHGGLFHLILNMYALLQVGNLLETKFGNHRYFFVYIVTGITASIASIAVNDNIVSVGASGAIFGLYGLFLSLLLLKALDIPKESRKNFLSSIAIFIAYNLMLGFAKEGIDNAAHIGGLISGFFIGFFYYPSIKRPRISQFISAGIAMVLLIVVFLIPHVITNKPGEFQAVMEIFAVNEEKALWMSKVPSPAPDEIEQYSQRLRTEGIELWEDNLQLLNSLTDMPSYLQERVDLLKTYCDLRIKSCEVMQELLLHDEQSNRDRINALNAEIEGVIDKLENLNN